MSVTSISDLARQHMLNILGYSTASQAGQTSNSATSTNTLSIGGTNSNQLSPFAEMLTQLQKLEESNPGQYAKVSQQISTNLSTASSTALARGNTALASKLSTLSQDFSTASQSGQLPNIGDLESTMQTVGQTNAAGTLPTGGSHSKTINIIGQALSMVGI